MSLQSSMQDYYDDAAYASRTACFRTMSVSSLWCLQMPNIWPFSRVEYDDVDQDYPLQTNGGYQQYQPSHSLHGASLPTAQPIFSSHLASTAFSGSSITGRGDYSGSSSSSLHLTDAYSIKRRVDDDLYADRMMRQDSRLEDDEFFSTVDRKSHKSSSKSRKESKKDRSSSSRSHRSSSSKDKSRSSSKSHSKPKSTISLGSSPTKLSSSPSASPAILHRDEDASSGESSEDELIEVPPRKPTASPPPSSDNQSVSQPIKSSVEPASAEHIADTHERALPSVSPVPGENIRK